jgi:cobalt/nickel transport system permease protein
MHTDYVDRFSRRRGVMQHIDARAKLLSALLLVATIVATPMDWWSTYVVLTIVVLALFAAARLPWSYLFKRLAVALPFLMFVAAGVPMSRGFADGFDFAVALLLRAMLSLTIMTTLVATTPFAALLAALEQVRVPRLLIWVLAFMYRYLFVLSDELVRMRRAKLARSLRWNLWSEFRLLGNFWGVLFVRAFERAERIHAAMCARGWSVERFLTEQV